MSFLSWDMSPIVSLQTCDVFLISLYCVSELVIKESLINFITVSSKKLRNYNSLCLPSISWYPGENFGSQSNDALMGHFVHPGDEWGVIALLRKGLGGTIPGSFPIGGYLLRGLARPGSGADVETEG